MKVPLKLGTKPVKQWPYRLNPRYKEKVKEEIDTILDAGIIENVEESQWIILMVVNDNKTSEVHIYVDL